MCPVLLRVTAVPQPPDEPADSLPELRREALQKRWTEWRTGAAKGDPECQCRWARLIEGPQRYVEAAKWYRAAAEQNHPEAQYRLGACYANGYGVAKDEAEAVKWYHKAAHQNHALAQYHLGVCYASGKGMARDEVEAARWYRKLAEQTDAEVQWTLGVCYITGQEGVVKDYAEAVKWYRRAAEQNFPLAQGSLADCYYEGCGAQQDYAEAARWYRKAAEQGHTAAKYSLAYCYVQGQGVEKDYAEAVKWFHRADEYNDSRAQYWLGECYANGWGVVEDGAEAVRWYRKAAEGNDADAQFVLGWCYENGQGVEKNQAEAVRWYRKAAEQNDPRAQYNLGVCHENGEGVAKDEAEAVKWYRRAAEQNDADAQYALGVCYESGQGVERDEVEASYWYRKAAEQNQPQAKQRSQPISAPSSVQELSKLDDLMDRLNSLIGLSKVKQDAVRIINLVKVRRMRQEKGMKVTPMSLHLVFTGNPGTGKTTVARLLGEIYHEIGILSKGHLTETDRSGLVAGYLGQTAIKVSEVVQGALGGILFIDEAYSLAQDGQRDQFGREAIDTLLKRMEDHRDDLIVIVAGYTAPMKAFLESNPGLRSRFNKFLHFDDYSPEELFQIFAKYCGDEGYSFEDACAGKIRTLINLTHERRTANFGNARTIRNLFEQTISNHANRVASIASPSQNDLTTILPPDVPSGADA